MRKKADASRKGASAFCAFGDLFAGAIRQRGRIDPVRGKCAGKEKITERRKSSTRERDITTERRRLPFASSAFIGRGKLLAWRDTAAEWEKCPPVSSAFTERRKSSTRGKRHNHGTEKVTFRVQRVYRAGEAFGMARHSCGMGKVSSRVQRVYRAAKTSGAMEDTSCPRRAALRVRRDERQLRNGKSYLSRPARLQNGENLRRGEHATRARGRHFVPAESRTSGATR